MFFFGPGIRYLVDWLRDSSRYDAVEMGYSIEARYKRCRPYWAKHLEYSKQSLINSCSDRSGGKAAILGAGRLLDVPVLELLERFDELHLVDFDPVAVDGWQSIINRERGRVFAHCLDLTNGLTNFKHDLASFTERVRSIYELERWCSTYTIAPLQFPIADIRWIGSVNLLGQLSLPYRDHFHRTILTTCGLDTDDEGLYPAELQARLDSLLEMIELQHLSLLKATEAERRIIITDSEYYFYERNYSEWQTTPALRPRTLSELGVEYREADSWLWHLAPQGIEFEEYGEIHRVEVFVGSTN